LIKRWSTKHHEGMLGCGGTALIIRGGGQAPKIEYKVRLGGNYVIGAVSVKGGRVTGEITVKSAIRSRDRTVWESEHCLLGEKACGLSRYREIVRLPQNDYTLSIEISHAEPGTDVEMCVTPVPIAGGLVVSGAVPNEKQGMRPLPGSTRSYSLMLSDPVAIGEVCVQRMWLWFFSPRGGLERGIVIRLLGNDRRENVIETELLRRGPYLEIVVDALVPPGGGVVEFILPTNLTRPLFTISTEGC